MIVTMFNSEYRYDFSVRGDEMMKVSQVVAPIRDINFLMMNPKDVVAKYDELVAAIGQQRANKYKIIAEKSIEQDTQMWLLP